MASSQSSRHSLMRGSGINWNAYEALAGIRLRHRCLCRLPARLRERILQALRCRTPTDHRQGGRAIGQPRAGDRAGECWLCDSDGGTGAIRARSGSGGCVRRRAPPFCHFGRADLLRHFDRILSAIDVPLVLQDFNPGGPTVSKSFIAKLHRQHPAFSLGQTWKNP